MWGISSHGRTMTVAMTTRGAGANAKALGLELVLPYLYRWDVMQTPAAGQAFFSQRTRIPVAHQTCGRRHPCLKHTTPYYARSGLAQQRAILFLETSISPSALRFGCLGLAAPLLSRKGGSPTGGVTGHCGGVVVALGFFFIFSFQGTHGEEMGEGRWHVCGGE